MVARLLLPLATTSFANTSNDPVSRTTSAASGLRGLDRWHNDLRVSAGCSVVQGAAVVGTVADDSTDLAWYAIDEVHANTAVINIRTGQPLADDHTIAVDTDVQLLPATNALAAVSGRRPLAFAEDGETTAVDD